MEVFIDCVMFMRAVGGGVAFREGCVSDGDACGIGFLNGGNGFREWVVFMDQRFQQLVFFPFFFALVFFTFFRFALFLFKVLWFCFGLWCLWWLQVMLCCRFFTFFFENVTSFYSYALLHTICYAPRGHSYVEREDWRY